MQKTYYGMERYIFSDAYNLFLKYKDMQNTDRNWEMCIEEANNLSDKYCGHALAKNIILATMEQIERIVLKKTLDGLTREQWEQKFREKVKNKC